MASPAPAATTATAAVASSFSYNASDDSYVSAKAPTMNFGTGTVLTAGSASGDSKVAYLKFIVHSLPAGSTNITAALTLTRTLHHLPPTVAASTVASNAWTEGSLTYQNRPAIGASLGAKSTTSATTSLTWAVPVVGNASYSFAITAPTTTDTARFYSAESASALPSLKVTYTPPPPAQKMWIGAATGSATDQSLATFQARSTTIGPLKMRRTFPQSVTAATTIAAADKAAGITSFLSLKPGLVTDTTLADLARALPAGTYLTINHEPENDYLRAADFVTMYRHEYQVVKAANPAVLMGPVHLGWAWRNSAGVGAAGVNTGPLEPPSAWDVGDGYRDFTGIDVYSLKTATPLSTFADFQNWYKYFAPASSKPLAIVEYGQYVVATGAARDAYQEAKRADTIAADHVWLKATNRFSTWLYWDATGAQGTWTIQDAGSQAAWRNVAAEGRVS